MNKEALAIFAGIFIALSYAFAGTMEYNDKKAAEQERSELNQGRIWSKRCAKKGEDILATKADGKPWVIHCVPKRTLKV